MAARISPNPLRVFLASSIFDWSIQPCRSCRIAADFLGLSRRQPRGRLQSEVWNWFRELHDSVDAGLSTSQVLPNLIDGTRYYFVVVAYDAARVEGAPSPEASGVVLATSNVAAVSVGANVCGDHLANEQGQ